MKETWGAWFYRRPTNPPNHEREWLGGIDSIEIVNLKIPWGLWFYRCIFRKRVRASRIITIKLSTPTLSLNSKGDPKKRKKMSQLHAREPARCAIIIPANTYYVFVFLLSHSLASSTWRSWLNFVEFFWGSTKIEPAPCHRARAMCLS